MTTKVTVNLPDQTVQALKELADKRGVTMTQVLRQSIENEQFLREEVNRGSKILLEEPDKSKRIVILPK